ncbi:site-specific DNA-methyltransferase [Xanthomonas campestris]|uniref:site-specific DNA-methyltransferase n=1 Tax=Xanthomonas campestris TaxID=339 RepID=UPI0020C9C869|nr:site-specific DNA-methyltransferase [Xanthomonas campestris]
MPLLSWFNRDEDLTRAAGAPYRLLEPLNSLSYGEADSPNMLIHGNNLDALKALLPYYAGQVKCIFIDPPYNTKSAFAQYDDNLEHSKWLSMMYPQLDLLKELLADDGSLWVSLDDNEAHYFKVIADEVFGRKNFIATIAWRKRDGAPNDRKIGSVHDHVMVWGKSKSPTAKATLAELNFNLMPRTDKANAQYRVFAEPDGPDERGAFRKIDTTANGKGGRFVQSLFYGITNPYTGEEVWPRKGTCWRHSKADMEALQKDRRLYWGVDGKAGTPMRKLFLEEAKKGMTTPTMWEDTGLNQHASREMELLFGEKAAFETPKPEALLHRIIHVASNPGDIVLDSFLGSGTTTAVAHKMNRRWIGVEFGDHVRTLCHERMKKVVDGEQGGASELVGWEGGGGFRFYKLGAPVFDENGHIREDIRFEHLAAHVWFAETGCARSSRAPKVPFLGAHGGVGYYLLFNGILGDESKTGGNVLTNRVLRSLEKFEGPKVIYGESCALSDEQLHELEITFKQTPYDIKAR